MDTSVLMPKFNLEEIDKQLGNRFGATFDIVSIDNVVLTAQLVQGALEPYTHKDDELVFVYRGQVTLETGKGIVVLNEGEGIVMPRGTTHTPESSERSIMLFLRKK